MLLQPDEILKIINAKVAMYRDRMRYDYNPEKDKYEYPEFYEGYNELCKDYYAIQNHSVKGVFPAQLFRKRSPNQTEEEYLYIKENYKQTTLPVYKDFVSSIQRAFNDNNWSVEYAQDHKNAKDYREYVESGIPRYYSVENYIRHITPGIKLRDAMGVTVIKPTIPLKRTGTEIKEDDQQLRRPEIYYFQTPLIWGFEYDKYYLILSHEKSIVKNGGQPKRSGLVFWFVDEVFFYKFEQVGDTSSAKWKFELTETLEHKSGSLPVSPFRGVPVINSHGQLVYQSEFLYSVDALDLVTLDQSNLQISKNKCVYPTQVMIGNECDFIDLNTNDRCINGYMGIEGTANYRQCQKCKGSGLKSRISPMGTLLLRAKSRENPDAETIDNALKYVSPEITTLEFLRKEIFENFKTARSILHLKVTETNGTGENPIESGSNQKALYAFIKPISDQMFNLYEWILDMIGMQRYGEDYPNPKVLYPKSFEFLTDEDYLMMIQKATEANAPPFVLYNLMWKYFTSIYYSDSESVRMTNLLMKTDRLIALSNADIQNALLNDTAAAYEKILHESGINFIIDLEQSDEKFWEKDFEDQQQLLIEKAKAKANDVNPALIQTGGKVNKLKDTVGGLTGMIEIARSVSEGVYDLDAAIALVIDRFGVSEEDARKQLGTPNPAIKDGNS